MYRTFFVLILIFGCARDVQFDQKYFLNSSISGLISLDRLFKDHALGGTIMFKSFDELEDQLESAFGSPYNIEILTNDSLMMLEEREIHFTETEIRVIYTNLYNLREGIQIVEVVLTGDGTYISTGENIFTIGGGINQLNVLNKSLKGDISKNEAEDYFSIRDKFGHSVYLHYDIEKKILTKIRITNRIV